MNYTGLAIAVGLAAFFSGVLIWVVGMLGLGLEVDGPGPAFIAGFAIALVGGVITSLLMLTGMKVSNGLLRFLVNALLGAVVLLIMARYLPGLSVDGFTGAMVASVAVGVIAWLLSLPLKRINQEADRRQKPDQAP